MIIVHHNQIWENLCVRPSPASSAILDYRRYYRRATAWPRPYRLVTTRLPDGCTPADHRRGRNLLGGSLPDHGSGVLWLLDASISASVAVLEHLYPDGHISLLFDSFAVVLLLSTGVTFLPLPGTKERFNAFAVKTAAAFCALTVGGGFYLGELWGLPYYISNGLDVPLAGFPLLLVLTPYCMMVAYLVAKHYPVQMQETVFDKQQLLAAVEFSTALILLIVTQSPFLCIGALLLYTALRRKTDHLVQKTAHELMGGAQHALGLVILAVIILESGNAPLVQPYLSGVGLFIGAAISSPFAGAMAPAANNLHDFYVGLSLLMCGAPLFVFSSLVAIVVFTGTIDYEDMPGWMKPLTALVGGKKQGFVQEALTYTLFILPLTAGLGILLFVANQLDLFATAATWLGVSMGTPPASH